MKKRIGLLIAVLVVAFSGLAAASPMTDLSAGKVAVDLLNWTPDLKGSLNAGGYNFGSDTISGNGSLQYGITVGVAQNWGVYFRGFDAQSQDKPIPGYPLSYNYEMSYQQYGLEYGFGENFAVFAGGANAKGKLNISPLSFSSADKNAFQIGAIAQAPVGKDLKAYGRLAVGGDITDWEIGLSYLVAKNTELTLNYREVYANKLDFGSGITVDGNVKGLGYGLTFKF